jgi:hypothetical protein
VTALVAGPAGYLPVLAVVLLLVTREFRRVARPTPARRPTSVASVLTCSAGLLAFGILALRFIGFS